MSLWSADLDSLTFEQLDEFLSIKEPENVRLDYKAQCPGDIENIMCAFANTLGGLIVIGVHEDRVTNEPVWPPQAGIDQLQSAEKGLVERIQSKANNAVYPPVAIEISNVVENRHAPGKVLVVVKVHLSKLSPHAVSQRTRALVYERSKNQAQPYQLADIDQIQAMLKRRTDIEKLRYEFVEFEHLSMGHIFNKTGAPLRWLAIQPYFPIDYLLKIKESEECLDNSFNQQHSGTVSRVHDGAYKTYRGHYFNQTYLFSGNCKLSTKGQFYFCEVSYDFVERHKGQRYAEGMPVLYDLNPLIRMLATSLTDIGKLYQGLHNLRPEYYSVQYGVKEFQNVHFQMKGFGNAKSIYPYQTLEREFNATLSDLTENRGCFLSQIVEDMFLTLDFDRSFNEHVSARVKEVCL